LGVSKDIVELGNPISAIQRKWIEHFFSYVGAQAEHTLAFYTPRPSRAERGMAKLRFLEDELRGFLISL
jgi:hypothetical protein